MDSYRLPRTVVPTRYELRLAPDLESARFNGEEVIHVVVQEPVQEFVLNAVDLYLGRTTLLLGDGRTLHPSVTLDSQNERCRLHFEQIIPPGTYRLFISFAGTLNDQLRGFYRSRFQTPSGETRWLAATQFEATDARRAFPCWDEPAFRAIFSISLVIDPGWMALSSGPVLSEQVEGGRKIVRFAETMPLSTYLIAFVVGQLEATEPVQVGKTPVRVWCVPGKRALAEFGREVAVFSLGFFEDYFGIDYPGEKLDLIAIPDFAAGAMENFGLITFRETALLVDPQSATLAEQERVADVVSHENAHMWFGDLVTMSWWNGLWLKEAFATFMEMLAVDAWKRPWRRWETFAVSRSAAFLVDGLHSSRPVEFAVRAPQDAEAMYDVLTYEKGCAVLRMLEQYLGPDLFRTGVHFYLQQHAHGNTETADLWNALGEASGEPIPAIMDGWIFQPGYPVITVLREADRLILWQQRFLYLPVVEEDPAFQQRWQVPLQIKFVAGGSTLGHRLLLAEKDARLPLPDGFEVALVNVGGHGFYRVRYETSLLEAILAEVGRGGLSSVERFNLLNDCWALTLAGQSVLTDYLDMMRTFHDERDRNVWSVLANAFQTLGRIVDDADRSRLASLIRNRAGTALANLGWSEQPGEDELTQQLRGDLLRLLGILGEDLNVQRYALQLLTEESLPASVCSAVIAIGAHTGDESRYQQYLERLRSARTPQEEQRYLLALAGFRHPALIEQSLQRALSKEVRTQDAPFLIRALLMNPFSREQAWAFVKANWDRMRQEYPIPAFRRMCEGITGLSTPALEEDVHRFLRERQPDLGGKALAQYLEHLRILVAFQQREGPKLSAYLAGE